ncbi:MAG: viroplasmin family protein [Clostridia bacterium]|nr:viroplasmin family protein [Clostridia bacterium]
MKYYAVKVGRTVGIFDNWTECNASIKGFPGQDFKSFNSKEEAAAYLDDKDLWNEIVSEDINQGYLVAFCDGSYEKNLNRYSYGVVLIDKNHNETSLCGYGNNQKYISSNNIIGEIFGVINALDWAVSNGHDKIKIYHDYEGLSKWISGEWQAKSDVAKMFTAIYSSKFDGVLDIKFKKVKGHSNNKYNDKADSLAKSALQDRTKMAIQGDHWFVLPYFKEDDFQALADLIKNENDHISITTKDYPSKKIYKFELDGKKIVATLFKSKNQKVLIQGENSVLFQMIISIIVELDDTNRIEPILSSAYRTTIDAKKIDNSLNAICPNLPTDYPQNTKRLIRQSIINLNYFVESEEYSQYAYSALRALEGHIKYLITSSGGSVGRTFNTFNKNKGSNNLYYYTGQLTDTSKIPQIEKCYNYYKAERDTIFHYGEFLGNTDNTRMLETKDYADEIIKKCLALICE